MLRLAFMLLIETRNFVLAIRRDCDAKDDEGRGVEE
jgi:hypothetical protein